MGLDLYFNILWFVPLAAWFATRNTSPIVRGAITGALFGLVVSYALKGLYALYFIWPVSDWLGQGVFYLRFIHDVSATRVAIVLQLISADSPVTADQRLLLEVVKTVLGGGLTYGFLGFLLGYFRHKYQQKNGYIRVSQRPKPLIGLPHSKYHHFFLIKNHPKTDQE